MMDLPPGLLAAYVKLAGRLFAEEQIGALDNEMVCLATLWREKGSPNYYAQRRAELFARAQGESGGTPLSDIVRRHLARTDPGNLARFEMGEPSPAENALRQKLYGTAEAPPPAGPSNSGSG